MRRLALMALILLLLSSCGAPLEGVAPPVVATGVSADSWAVIPAGAYLEGQFDHEATIPYDYEIMVTEVTNAQVADYLNAALAAGDVTSDGNAVMGHYPGDVFHGHDHEIEIAAGDWELMPVTDPALRLTFSGGTFSWLPGYENHPATMVSWFGAWSYCQAQGWRLPTDAEWEKAARGTGNRPYPWGDDVGGAFANFSKSGDPFEASSRTTPVGFYDGGTYAGFVTSDGASPYGVYDMAGNVWEWTGDIHDGTHDRSLRGGSHRNYGYDLRIWSHNNADPRHTSPSVGFRCARDG